MFIKGLTKSERIEAGRFDPNSIVGEYVKVEIFYSDEYKKACPWTTDYVKFYRIDKLVNEYQTSINSPGDAKRIIYEGISTNDFGTWIQFTIDVGYTLHYQCNVYPITRDEFIEGFKSELSPIMCGIINFDKL